jgi:hypothetical protein
MAERTDPEFFERADAHITLSNTQVESVGRGKVSASMLYSAARFNAWVSACGFENAAQMREGRAETLKYFVEQYERMLGENLDDYIKNFDRYMNAAH